MSLQTDIIFVKALRSNGTLIEKLPAGDVYNTAIPLPEEDADNVPLPYIIVSYDGLNTQDTTKDDQYDGTTDRVQIGIEIAAKERPQLAELAIMVRKTVHDYFRTHAEGGSVLGGLAVENDAALIPYSYDLQAQPVQYDSMKPCFWQRLTYTCDTDPDE